MEDSAIKTQRVQRLEQRRSDFRWLMGDARGRRRTMSLLADMGLCRCAYDGAVKDPALEMAFREGRKNLGYKLLSEIDRFCPESYFQMLKENRDE